MEPSSLFNSLPTYDQIIETDAWKNSTPEERDQHIAAAREQLYSGVVDGTYGIRRKKDKSADTQVEDGQMPVDDEEDEIVSGLAVPQDSVLPNWINDKRRTVRPEAADEIEGTINKLIALRDVYDNEAGKKMIAEMEQPETAEGKIQQAFVGELVKGLPDFVSSLAARDFGLARNDDPNAGVLLDQTADNINKWLKSDSLKNNGADFGSYLNWLSSRGEFADFEANIGTEIPSAIKQPESMMGQGKGTMQFDPPEGMQRVYNNLLRQMIPDREAFQGNPVAVVNGSVQFDVTNEQWKDPGAIEAAIDRLEVSPVEKARAKERMNPIYESLINAELITADMRDWTDGLPGMGGKVPSYVDEKGNVSKDYGMWKAIGLAIPFVNNMIEGSGANTADQRKIMVRGQFEQGKDAKDVWRYYKDAYGVDDRGMGTNIMAALGGSVMKYTASQMQAAEWMLGINRTAWANEINKVDNGFAVMRDKAVAAQIGAKAPYFSVNTPLGVLDVDTPDLTDLAVQVHGAKLAGSTGGAFQAGRTQANWMGHFASRNAIGHSIASSTAYSAASSYASSYQEALMMKGSDGLPLYTEDQANTFAMRNAVINGSVTAAVTHLTGYMVGSVTNPKDFLSAFNSTKGGWASKLGAGFKAAGYVGGAESSDFVKTSLREVVRDAYVTGGKFGRGGMQGLAREVAKQTGDKATAAFSRDMAKTAVKGMQDFIGSSSKGAIPAFVAEGGKRFLANTSEEAIEEVFEQIGQNFLNQLAVVANAMPQELNAEGWFPSAMTLVKSAALGAIGGAHGAVVENISDLHETVVKDAGFRRRFSENVKQGMKVLRELKWSDVAQQAPTDAARQVASERGIDLDNATPEQRQQIMADSAGRADTLAKAQLFQQLETRLSQTDPQGRLKGLFSTVFKGAMRPRKATAQATADGQAVATNMTLPPTAEESSTGFQIKIGRSGSRNAKAVTIQIHKDGDGHVPRSTVFERIFGEAPGGTFWNDDFKDSGVKMADINLRPMQDGRYQVFVGDQPTTRGYDPQSDAFSDLDVATDGKLGMRAPVAGMRFFDARSLQVKSPAMNRTALGNGAVFSDRGGNLKVKLSSTKAANGQTRWTIRDAATNEVRANTSSTKTAIQWLHRNGFVKQAQAGEAVGGESAVALTQITSFDKNKTGEFAAVKPKITAELESLANGSVLVSPDGRTIIEKSESGTFQVERDGKVMATGYDAAGVAAFANGAKVYGSFDEAAAAMNEEVPDGEGAKGGNQPSEQNKDENFEGESKEGMAKIEARIAKRLESDEEVMKHITVKGKTSGMSIKGTIEADIFADGDPLVLPFKGKSEYESMLQHAKDAVREHRPNSEMFLEVDKNRKAYFASEKAKLKARDEVEAKIKSRPPHPKNPNDSASQTKLGELHSEDAPGNDAVPVGDSMLPQEIAEIPDFGSVVNNGEVVYSPFEDSEVDTIDTRLDVGSFVMSPGTNLQGEPEMRYWRVTGKETAADGTETYKVERINDIDSVREEMGKILFDGREGALRGIAEALQRGEDVLAEDVDAAVELMVAAVVRGENPASLLHPDGPRDGRTASFDVDTGKIRINRRKLLATLKSRLMPFRIGSELDAAQQEDFDQIVSDVQNAFAFQLMEELAHKASVAIFNDATIRNLAQEMADSESPFVSGYLWKLIGREYAVRGIEMPAEQDINTVPDMIRTAAVHELLANFAMVNRTGMTVGTMHDNAVRFFDLVNDAPANESKLNRAINRLVEMTRRYMTALKNWWGAQALMRQLPNNVLHAVARIESELQANSKIGDFDFYNVRERALQQRMDESAAKIDKTTEAFSPEFYEARSTLRMILENFKERGLNIENVIDLNVDEEGMPYLTLKPEMDNLPYRDELLQTVSTISANAELMRVLRDKFVALNDARMILAGRNLNDGVSGGTAVEVAESLMRQANVVGSGEQFLTTLERLMPDFLGRVRAGEIGFNHFQRIVRQAADSYLLGGSHKLRGLDPAKLAQMRGEALSRYYQAKFDAGVPESGLPMDPVPATAIPGLSEGEQLAGYPQGLPTDLKILRSDLAAIEARLLEVNGVTETQVPWANTDPEGTLNFPPRDVINFPQLPGDMRPVNMELQAAIIDRKQMLLDRINQVKSEGARDLQGDYNPTIKLPMLMSPSMMEATLDPERGRTIFDGLRYAADVDLVSRRSNDLVRELNHELFGAPSVDRVMRMETFTMDSTAIEDGQVNYFTDNAKGYAAVGNNPLPFSFTAGIFVAQDIFTTNLMGGIMKGDEDLMSGRVRFSQQRNARLIAIPFSPDKTSTFALIPEVGRNTTIDEAAVIRALGFSYEVFGLRSNTYVPGPNGVGTVGSEAHYAMSQNIPMVTFNAMSSMLDAYFQKDGSVSDLDMETGGFPLAVQTKVEEKEGGIETLVNQHFAWPKELFKVPQLFDPANKEGPRAHEFESLSLEKAESLREMLDHGIKVMHALGLGSQWFYEKMAGDEGATLRGEERDGYNGDRIYTASRLYTSKGLTPAGLAYTLVAPHLIRVSGMLSNPEFWRALDAEAGRSRNFAEKRDMLKAFRDALLRKEDGVNVLLELPASLQNAFNPSKKSGDIHGFSPVKELNEAFNQMRYAMKHANFVMSMTKRAKVQAMAERFNTNVRNGRRDMPINPKLLGRLQFITDYQRMLASRFIADEKNAFIPDMVVPVSAKSLHQALSHANAELNERFGMTTEEAYRLYDLRVMNSADSKTDLERKAKWRNAQEQIKVDQRRRNLLTLALMTLMGNDSTRVSTLLRNPEYSDVEVVYDEERGTYESVITFNHQKLTDWVLAELAPYAHAEAALGDNVTEFLDGNDLVKRSLPEDWYGMDGVLDKLLAADRNDISDPATNMIMMRDRSPSPLAKAFDSTNTLEEGLPSLSDLPPIDPGQAPAPVDQTRSAETIGMIRGLAGQLSKAKTILDSKKVVDEFSGQLGMMIDDGRIPEDAFQTFSHAMSGDERARRFVQSIANKYRNNTEALGNGMWLPDAMQQASLWTDLLPQFADALEAIADDLVKQQSNEPPTSPRLRKAPPVEVPMAASDDHWNPLRSVVRDSSGNGLQTTFGTGGIRVFNDVRLKEGQLDIAEASKLLDENSGQMDSRAMAMAFADLVKGLPIVTTTRQGWDMTPHLASDGTKMAAFIPGIQMSVADGRRVLRQLIQEADIQTDGRHEASLRTSAAHLVENLGLLLGDEMALKSYQTKLYMGYRMRMLDAYRKAHNGEAPPMEQRRMFNRITREYAKLQTRERSEQVKKLLSDPSFGLSISTLNEIGSGQPLSKGASLEILTHAMFSKGMVQAMRLAWQPSMAKSSRLETAHPLAVNVARSLLSASDSIGTTEAMDEEEAGMARDTTVAPDSIRNKVMQLKMELADKYGDDMEGMLTEMGEILTDDSEAVNFMASSDFTRTRSRVEDDSNEMLNRMSRAFDPVMRMIESIQVEPLAELVAPRTERANSLMVEEWALRQKVAVAGDTFGDRIRSQEAQRLTEQNLSGSALVKEAVDFAKRFYEITDEGRIEQIIPVRVKAYDEKGKVMRFDAMDLLDQDYVQLDNGERVPVGDGDFVTAKDHQFYDRGRRYKSDFAMAYFGLVGKLADRTDLIKVTKDNSGTVLSYHIDISGDNLKVLMEAAGINDEATEWLFSDDADILAKAVPSKIIRFEDGTEKVVTVYDEARRKAKAEQELYESTIGQVKRNVELLRNRNEALTAMAMAMQQDIRTPDDWYQMIKQMRNKAAARGWDEKYGSYRGKGTAEPLFMSADDVYGILESNGYNAGAFTHKLAEHILSNLDEYTQNPHKSIPLAIAFDELGKSDALYAKQQLKAAGITGSNRFGSSFGRVQRSLADLNRAESSEARYYEPDSFGEAIESERASQLRRAKRLLKSGPILRQLNERQVERSLNDEYRENVQARRLAAKRFESGIREMEESLFKLRKVVMGVDMLRNHPEVQDMMALNPLFSRKGRMLRSEVRQMSEEEFKGHAKQIGEVMDKVINDPVQRLYGMISPGLRTALEGRDSVRSRATTANRFGDQIEQVREFDNPWAQGPYNTHVMISPDLLNKVVDIVAETGRRLSLADTDPELEGASVINQFRSLYPKEYRQMVAGYYGVKDIIARPRHKDSPDADVFNRMALFEQVKAAIEQSMILDSAAISENLTKAASEMMAEVYKATEQIALYDEADAIAAELRDFFLTSRKNSRDSNKAGDAQITPAGEIALEMFRANYFADEKLRREIEEESTRRQTLQREAGRLAERNDRKPTRRIQGFDPETGNPLSINFKADNYETILTLKNVMDSFLKTRWEPAYALSKTAGLWAEGMDASNLAAVNASKLAVEASLTDLTIGGTNGTVTNDVFVPDDAQERITEAYKQARLAPTRSAREVASSIASSSLAGQELASSEMFEPFTDTWFAATLNLSSTEYRQRQAKAEMQRNELFASVMNHKGNKWMIDAYARESARLAGTAAVANDPIAEVEDRMYALTRRVIEDLVNYHAFNDMNPVSMNDPIMAKIATMIGASKTAGATTMAPDLHQMFKLYAELKGATIGDKILTTLAGGFVSTNHYKALAYFMEQNALMHRMFARSLTAANEARDVLAWIENGIDGMSGREGFKTAEMNIHGMIEKESRKVKGDKNHTAEELRSLGYMIAQLRGALRPKLNGKNSLVTKQRRVDKVRQEWEHGMIGLNEAMQADASLALRVVNWMRAKINRPPAYWESFKQKFLTNGYEVKANYEGSLRNYRVMDDFASTMKVSFGFDTKLRAHLAQQGYSAESISQMFAYSDTIYDTMSRLHDVYAGMSRFSGAEVDTNPVPTRFKMINLGKNSMSTQDAFSNESLSENLLNMRRSLLEPSLEYQDGVIRAWDADGLRAPLRVISDLLYRMNVAPSYEVVRHLVGEAEVKDSTLGFGGKLMQRQQGINEPVFMRKARTIFGSHDPESVEAATASVNVLASMVETELQYDRQVKQEGTLLEALAFRLGTFGMYQVLSSAWQIPRQTLPAFLAYSVLRGNGKAALSVFSRYVKAAIRGRASQVTGFVANDPDTNFHDKVAKFVQEHSPYVFLRGPNGVNLAARTIDWSNPMGAKLADKMGDKMFANLLIGAGHAAGVAGRKAAHALDWTATENLDWFMARPEQAAVRSIFVSELYRLSKERGLGDQWASVDDMLDDGSFVPHISDLGKARTTSVLIMAQSDSSKKGQIFHRGNNMWINMLRSSLITFGNHLMTTAAHSHAGYSMIRHGDADTQGEGMNMIASSLAQNVAYGFFTYDLMIKMLSLVGAAFGAGDDDREKFERAMNFQWFGDNKWLAMLSGFAGRTLTGSRGEFGYDVRKDAATDEATSRRVASLFARTGQELVGQAPFLGMLAATKPGQDVNAAVWQGLVRWLSGGQKTTFTLAGTKIKPLLSSDNMVLNRLGSAIEGVTGFVNNHGDSGGYTGVGLASLTKGMSYFSNRRKEGTDAAYDTALTALYLMSYLGTRDMRGAIEDEMRRAYNVQLYEGPTFPKRKGVKSGRGSSRGGRSLSRGGSR